MGSYEELFAAIQAGDVEAAKGLVRTDPTVVSARTPEGVPALMMALYYAQNEIAELLASQRSEVDFFEAVALGQKDRVEESIGASRELIGQHASDGFTGLHLAAFFGHLELVELLLSYGADPDTTATGSMDVRPIHSAAAGRKPESIVPIVKALLSGGAGINRLQQGGFTALHAAAAAGNEELLRVLLGEGADAGTKTDDGKSAFDLAIQKGHELCAGILKAHSD
jgi:ankyrin repeat protein